MIIMGIDPGLGATGYSFIEADGRDIRLVAAGDVRPPRKQPLKDRLRFLHDALAEQMLKHRPQVAVLEKVFTHHAHVTTASLMSHARGVVCLAVQERGIVLEEYLPTRVKRVISGNGHASKDQVARMVGHWIGALDDKWSRDTTDALALAITYVHVQSGSALLGSR